MHASRQAICTVVFLSFTVPALCADEIAPYVVLTGRDSSVAKPECQRVTSQTEWKALWDRHSAQYPKVGPGLPMRQRPAVDFRQCMVVAVFLGSTWNIEGVKVLQVLDQQDEFVIGYTRLSYQTEGEGDEATPYGFFVLPRSMKPLLLQIDTRNLREKADRQPPKWKEDHRIPPVERVSPTDLRLDK